jgi:hypothetical protein
VVAEFDPRFLADSFGPLEEFSTGHPWERRKFLAREDGRRVLLKFAGLGAIGERKLEMARALHAAGFTPEPLGLVHGFLIERWCDDARQLDVGEKPVEVIGRYVGARARLFPANESSGATIDELLAMCRRNIALALGEDAARAVDRRSAPRRRIARVRTDNKLDRQEWLYTSSGRLLKTDALDHHQSHDLIGCQPAEWDIAGAISEFELDATETARLVAATGYAVDPGLLDFFRIAYAAFRLGQARVAAETAGSAAQVRQLRRNSDRYARALHDLLHESTNARESAEFLV